MNLELKREYILISVRLWNFKDGGSYKVRFLALCIKFGLSEKHTKFEKHLPYGFEKSADLLSKCQNNKDDFFKLYLFSQKLQTLTCIMYPRF